MLETTVKLNSFAQSFLGIVDLIYIHKYSLVKIGANETPL